tara:strand:- start:20 stop:1474 length:1455 start_codon:yes stop_codon:yes gene_type:complete
MTSLATSPNTNENINTPAFAPDSNSSSITPGTIASPSINIPCPEDSNNDDDPSTKLTGSASNNVSDDSNTSEPENTASSSSPSDGVAPWVKTVFNATVLNILFWLITIYIIYRLGLAIFAKKPADAVSSGQLGYSRTIDITLALVIVLALMGSYYSMPKDEQDNLTGYTIEWTYNFFNDPWSLLILIWFTIIFFLLVYILRVPTAPDVKPVLVALVEDHIWIFFLIFGIIFFFKYVLNINIVALLLNNDFMRYLQGAGGESSSAPGAAPSWWSDAEQGIQQSWDNIIGEVAPSSSTTETQPSETSSSFTPPSSTSYTSDSNENCTNKQVFNVSQNKYTYKQAQQVCQALDASLATYDQIEQAYNEGAEWCNYGWSEGQMAYFPTQKETYNKLMENPYTKNACGRPGINGGFMGNPNLRFGVNCYGIKPEKPEGWTAPKIVPPPSPCEGCTSKEDKEKQEYEKKMEKLRQDAKLNGFNSNEWSEY